MLGIYVIAPTFLDPISADPPALLGQPAGIVVLGLGPSGRPGIRRDWATSSRIGVLVAELFFTLPALFTIILTAPVVLIVQRFGQI